ncbi:MAG TPA: hypothetical protein VGX03_04080 [Candidatus Binatia bacterium]|nr:hypothetical protein [Candidatus Binatia bacterium]
MSENEVSIVRRAIEILRLLIDSKTAGKDHMVVADIMKNMGTTEDEYWPADDFLTQQGYANPTLGGTSGVV